MSAFFERVRAALAPKGYAVLRELGSGGMGIVVLARQGRLDRLVAVKVIRPEMHTAIVTERFRREAVTLAGLSHPNIVPVYEADDADGFTYYTMQFLEGETVADRLRKGPMPAEEVRKVGRDLLDALELAHAHGVIHRDVKPANVFLTDGRAVLVDFGIAKRVPQQGDAPDGGEELTTPGVRVGTPGYMSPEQLSGAEATPASDLYAAVSPSRNSPVQLQRPPLHQASRHNRAPIRSAISTNSAFIPPSTVRFGNAESPNANAIMFSGTANCGSCCCS